MVRLREISRTAVFAWSPGAGTPLIVTGTRTGAVNDDFSNETKLELWSLGLDKVGDDAELQPAGSLTTDAGFNDIAWSEPSEGHPLGVIAGALDNGSVDLWDASKLLQSVSDAFISRTSKHSGAVKALQWNPWRHNLLASAGAKGEIFIYDLNNMANPFRLGASAARADDIECLDWNKQEKTAHILATGSSGGFVTVWDVKQKKDILTLNNQGRKAVSAVAWDPEESTKLATATPNDQEPLIFLWSLRNSSAPERTLKGHELGVLGLAWCLQDPELLLSCGKDNRTICWNPKTGERYGDFAAGSNWAFQTKWNPHNPNLIASASFDGKILITTTQATNTSAEDQAQATQALDGEDFFAKAQAQPQGISFNLPKAPKWAARPASVSFGFGGRLVRVGKDASKKSKITIETFTADTAVGVAAEKFEEKIQSGDVAGICESKIAEVTTDEEKADWQVIQTLSEGKSRKKIREYIGFADEANGELAEQTEKLELNGHSDTTAKPEVNGDDDDFFGNGGDSDNFLAQLASTKGAKTNSPFSIYVDSDSDADKEITRALLLGQFEKGLDICLKEDRISDAFMIAVCGGPACIDKVQTAYLKKKAQGPNYLRLLASVVGKNLWDVVHNADLQHWKDVMAALCTYADETEFSDLCEALGDRLEEAAEQQATPGTLRRDASFCYLVGSKLEKVVNIWVQELHEQEKSALNASETDNAFSVHARCLQDFIEKVSIFRHVTGFKDGQQQSDDDFKLAPLYRLYAEYADILAAHGQLNIAEQYVNLIPSKFDDAESSRERYRLASRKAGTATKQSKVAASTQKPLPQPTSSPFQPMNPLINQARNASPYAPAGGAGPMSTASPYAPPSVSPAPAAYPPAPSMYAPTGYQPPNTGYQPASSFGGYPPAQQQTPLAPPPGGPPTSAGAPPPSAAKNMTNWNDMPEGFIKERQPVSRRSTPAPVPAPFPNAQASAMSPPPPMSSAQFQPRQQTPLPPPPKAGEIASRVASPPTVASPPSQSTANLAYAPPQPAPGSTLPQSVPPPLPRGTSPYQPPPATSNAAPSSRYAPAPGSQPSFMPGQTPQQRTVAPNPYSQPPPGPYSGQQQPPPSAPSPVGAPPPKGPPRGPPPSGPARSNAPPRTSSTPGAVQLPSPTPENPAAAAQATRPLSAAAKPKYPRGDRSHVPPSAQPIIDLLSPEVARIKSVAPQAFKPQVDDMEKRINILFDHLNNEDLLQQDTIQQMIEISRCIQGREWDRAQVLFTEMQTAKLETEGTHWMVGIKRLIAIGRATKG